MAVIRLNKITGDHLESVVHTEDMVNGLFVQLGELVEGETELYEVKVPATESDLVDEFLLHATPEVDPDPRKAGLKHFVVEAGTAGRTYHLERGDVITLTEDLIDETPVVGEYVIPQVGSLKLVASADKKADASGIEPSLVLKVERETTLGYENDKAYQLRVIKA